MKQVEQADSSYQDVFAPLPAAVKGHTALSSLADSRSAASLSYVWLGRVCHRVSHEVGHCLGIYHCPYHACTMQGIASLVEDARKPPYLCLVDQVQVLEATGTSAESRYEALSTCCNQHEISTYSVHSDQGSMRDGWKGGREHQPR